MLYFCLGLNSAEMANIQVSIDPKSAIFEALQAGVSENTALMKEAENYLKTLETTPVFHLTLIVDHFLFLKIIFCSNINLLFVIVQEIITNVSVDVKVRWLSSVYFKNGIDKYWRKNASK